MQKIIKQNLVFIAITLVFLSVCLATAAYADSFIKRSETFYNYICAPSPYPPFTHIAGLLLFWFFIMAAIGMFYEIKTLRNIYRVLVALSLVTAVVFTISNILHIKDTRYRMENIDTLRFEMQEISLEQAGTIGDAHGLFVLYIGRDNCPDCVDMKELLENVAENYPVQILYYNTSNDRETRTDEMQAVLDKYSVTSVPTVLVFKWGVIEEIFQDYENPDAFIEIIESYREQDIYFTERQIEYLSEKYVW